MVHGDVAPDRAPKLDGKDQGKTFSKFDARFDFDTDGEQYERFDVRR